jgi:hypothetical protein
MATILAAGLTARTDDDLQTKAGLTLTGSVTLDRSTATIPPYRNARAFLVATAVGVSASSAPTIADAAGGATRPFDLWQDSTCMWQVQRRDNSSSPWVPAGPVFRTLPMSVGEGPNESDQFDMSSMQRGPQCLIEVTEDLGAGEYRAWPVFYVQTPTGVQAITLADGNVAVGTVQDFSGTSYHFAATGNDTTGDGSIGNPFATWTKAKTYLDGTVSDVACLFRAGDTFTDTARVTGFKAHDRVFVGTYGTGNDAIVQADKAGASPTSTELKAMIGGVVDSGSEHVKDSSIGGIAYDGNAISRGFVELKGSGASSASPIIGGFAVHDCTLDNINGGNVASQFINVSVGDATDRTDYLGFVEIGNTYGSATQHEVKQFVLSQCSLSFHGFNREAGTVQGAAHDAVSEDPNDLALNHRRYLNGGDRVTIMANDSDYLGLGASTGNRQFGSACNAGCPDALGATLSGVHFYLNRVRGGITGLDNAQSQFRRWTDTSDNVQANPTQYEGTICEMNLMEGTISTALAFLSTQTTFAFRHNTIAGDAENGLSLSVSGPDLELKYDADEAATPGSGEDFDPYQTGRIHDNLILGQCALIGMDNLNTGRHRIRRNIIVNETPATNDGLAQFPFSHVEPADVLGNTWVSDSVSFRDRVPPSTPISTGDYDAAQSTFEVARNQAYYAGRYTGDTFETYAGSGTGAFEDAAGDDFRLATDVPGVNWQVPPSHGGITAQTLPARAFLFNTDQLGLDSVAATVVLDSSSSAARNTSSPKLGAGELALAASSAHLTGAVAIDYANTIMLHVWVRFITNPGTTANILTHEGTNGEGLLVRRLNNGRVNVVLYDDDDSLRSIVGPGSATLPIDSDHHSIGLWLPGSGSESSGARLWVDGEEHQLSVPVDALRTGTLTADLAIGGTFGGAVCPVSFVDVLTITPGLTVTQARTQYAVLYSDGDGTEDVLEAATGVVTRAALLSGARRRR